jgi:5,10-methylenetetrahydromethanopterin reductase
MGVKFGINFVPPTPSELPQLCVSAEEAGYDRIGFVDSQCLYRELWVTCALAASGTSRIKVGPRVTNAETRHVAVTASATATLEELAPGRIFLGMGTGDSSVGNLGMKPTKLADMREAILAAKAMLSGSSYAYKGAECRIRWSNHSVPIYMAAHGPKALRIAGQVADGVVIGTGLTKDIVSYSVDLIAQGAQEVGRSLDDLDLWWLVGCNLADSKDAAVAEMRMTLAAMAQTLSKQVNNPVLVPPRYAEAIGTLSRRYAISEHLLPDAEGTNVQLVQRLGLEEYLAGRFVIAGNRDDCLRQIERAAEAGATQLWMSIYCPDPLRFVQKWGSEIMPRFA